MPSFQRTIATACVALAVATLIPAPARAMELPGNYEILPGQLIKIRQEGNRLTCSIGQQEARSMNASAGKSYRLTGSDATVTPQCDESGQVVSLEIKCYGEQVVTPRVDGNRTAARPNAEPRLPEAELLDQLVPRLMILHSVPGVSAVGVEDHAIAWERQWGVRQAGKPQMVDRDTAFEACSMSKPVFAYIVLQLVEQGRLDLDRPLVKYLDEPYLPDEPRHRAITARMVLSHTCGFPNWRKDGQPLRVLFEPGTKFQYSGEGFKYLQHVVEHITGEPLDAWARRALLDPLGMKISSFAWQERFDELAAAGHDEQGKVRKSGPRFLEANSAASLFCPPREYALFQLEMMRADRSAGHSLSQKMIDQMLARTSKCAPPKVVRRRSPAASPDSHYGLGWRMNATSQGNRFYHGGANGSGFRCYNEFDPKCGRALVIMTNGIGGSRLWEEVVATIAP